MLFNFYPCHEAEEFVRRELSKRFHLNNSNSKYAHDAECCTAQIADSKQVTVQEAFANLNEALRNRYGSCLCVYSIVLHLGSEYEPVGSTPFETLSELETDVLQWKIESAFIMYAMGVCVVCIVV